MSTRPATEQQQQDGPLGRHDRSRLLRLFVQAGAAALIVGITVGMGWALRLLRLLALAVVQAPRWAMVLLLSVIALGAYVAIENKRWLGVNRPLATIAVLVAAAVLFYWSTFIWRGVIAVAIVAAVAYVAFNLSGRVSLWFADRLLLDRQLDEVAFLLVLLLAPLLWAAAATVRWWVDKRRRA